MARGPSIAGQKFARLTAVEPVGVDKKGSVLWRCECECGGEKIVARYRLGHGDVRSCGCLQKDSFKARFTGHSKTRAHHIWKHMKSRCLSPNNKAYKNYGARGIVVCDRWLNSFENFLADMGHPPPGLSLDRIDNSRGYSPDNCRWATSAQQNRNRRDTVFITIDGATKPLTEWCEVFRMQSSTVRRRVKVKGWTWEDALRTPLQ